MIERDEKGRIKKGVSGNPSGRPKTSKLTAKDKKEFVKVFQKAVKDQDLKEAVSWLCERANDTNEIFKLLKEFAPYIVPKLSSLKTEVNEISEVRITFVDPEEPMTVIEHQKNKEIEEEDMK